MKKILLALSLLLIFGSNAKAQTVSSVIGEDLRKEMSSKSDDEFININIIFKAQYDRNQLRAKADMFFDWDAKREFVVNELKTFAEKNQESVKETMSMLQKSSQLEFVRSHWLCNSINCNATVDAINELASHPDILIMGHNKEQYLLFDEPSREVENDGSKELTPNITQVRANEVWDMGYTGEDVIVAVIDTGVNYNHYDLADHLWDGGEEFPYHGWDCYNDDNNPMDDHSHGTHCAGTVCGDGTAGSQTGMAPDATLMCIKVLGAGGNGSADQICSGVEFAVEHGAHIFSMSLGFGGGGTEAERIQFRGVMVNALEAGITGIVAAGNEGSGNEPNNVRVPGNCPPPWLHPDQTLIGGTTCVICIGAVDYNDNAASFTSHGPVTWDYVDGYNDYPLNPGMGLIRPDVCAPGVDIKSLNYSGNSGYTEMSGTSMATPCVAGVVALMYSKNNDLTPEEVCEILETTSIPLTETKSNIFGTGRIDAVAAVEEVINGPIIFNSCAINDNNGNQDGKFNPGETVSLDMSLINIEEYAVNNAVAIISTENEYITITDSIANIGSFQAGETINFSNQFNFTASEEMTIDTNVKFRVTFHYEGDLISKGNLKFTVYDYMLNVTDVTIFDTENGNGNGMLDPGENADICINISNSGNQEAFAVTGVLSTTSDYLTINNNEATLGTFTPEGQIRYARFNVTVSDDLPSITTPMPLSLTMTDAAGRVTEREIEYTNSCKVIFTLRDAGGNGWEGAELTVHFDDGTPNYLMLVPNNQSEKIYTLDIDFLTTVSLTWKCGTNDNDCTIDIDYESGDHIYSTCCSHAGVFFSWQNNCLGALANIYGAPTNLEATANGSNVSLSWTAPTRNDFVGYNVYRDNIMIADSITTTEYTDVELPLGIYTYTVDALYEGGIASEPSEPVSVEVTNQTIMGDVDGNSVVNVVDIQAVISYLMENEPSPFYVDRADMNGDGVINVLDIINIVLVIMENK